MKRVCIYPKQARSFSYCFCVGTIMVSLLSTTQLHSLEPSSSQKTPQIQRSPGPSPTCLPARYTIQRTAGQEIPPWHYDRTRGRRCDAILPRLTTCIPASDEECRGCTFQCDCHMEECLFAGRGICSAAANCVLECGVEYEVRCGAYCNVGVRVEGYMCVCV